MGILPAMAITLHAFPSKYSPGPHCIPDATLTMSSSELACAYAALALYDDGISITADKIAAVVAAAGLCVESYWPSLFAKLAEKRDIGDLLLNVGSGGGAAAPVSVAASAGGASASAAAPAVQENKEEPKEESDDDMGFSLFD